jgi:hypothetical protein
LNADRADEADFQDYFFRNPFNLFNSLDPRSKIVFLEAISKIKIVRFRGGLLPANHNKFREMAGSSPPLNHQKRFLR